MTSYGDLMVIPLPDGEIHVGIQEYNELGREGCMKKYNIPLGNY